MNEELVMSLILYSGNARTKLMKALKLSRNGSIEESLGLFKQANVEIQSAHVYQTQLISEGIEASDNLSLLTVHAQDHLMSTLVIRDLTLELIKRDAKERTNESRV